MSNDTKYGHLVHDGAFEPDEDTEEIDTTPRVELTGHTVTLKEHVADEYLSHYVWRFGVDLDDGQLVLRGWTKTDVEHNGTEDYCNEGTWSGMPADVKLRLADALGVRRSELEGMLDLPEHLLEVES